MSKDMDKEGAPRVKCGKGRGPVREGRKKEDGQQRCGKETWQPVSILCIRERLPESTIIAA